MIRLDKYLCDMGQGTRSEIKKAIKKGLTSVNGVLVKNPDMKIDETQDVVCYKGAHIAYITNLYYMLHKPAGCVCAATDAVHPTVFQYIENPTAHELFTIGRLDIDTEGLLIITNDGALSHQLLSPKKHIPKTYYAKIDGKVTQQDMECFQHGIDIGDEKPTLPAKLEILCADDCSEIRLTITEGRYHQVKRMFEAVGKKVTYLKRLAMNDLWLDETLAPGEYRELTQEELQLLRNRKESLHAGN